jgi:hypothetical protein
MASSEPYAPPADDGGDQGSHTVPGDSLAQPNPAAPEDRAAAGSFARGAAERTGGVRWRRFQGTAFTVLALLAFGSIAVVGAYCGR